MGVEPSTAHRRGDTIRRGSREYPATTGVWSYSLGQRRDEDWGLDQALNAVLDQLPDDERLWQELAERFQVDVFCGLFMGSDNQGTDIQVSTMARLAARHLTLELDIYGPPGP